MNVALSNPATARPHPAAERLLAAVLGMRAPFGHERSFRMSAGRLLADRFLLSVACGALGPAADAKLMNVFRDLGLPSSFQPAVDRLLPGSPFIHFAFEREPAAAVYKVYLEQPAPRTATGPVVLHHACKWNANAAGQGAVTSRYVWLPRLSAGEVEQRIRSMTGQHPDVGRAAVRIFQRACGDRGRAAVRFLQVSDEGTARLSFDLNLYDTNLRIIDAEPALIDVATPLGIDPAEVRAVCEPIRTSRVGHLAGGVHRDGRPFITVYHGVEGRHG